MVMERKSFMFYLEWQKQLELLSDEELRKFIYNLCKYHNGEEIKLTSKVVRLVWNGVLPAIRINNEKYENTVEKNRKNGKLGGRPQKKQNPNNPDGFSNNPNKPNGFSENPKNPIIDNREQIKENRKEVIDNSKKINEKRELVTGDSKKVIENGKMRTGNGKDEITNSSGVEDIFLGFENQDVQDIDYDKSCFDDDLALEQEINLKKEEDVFDIDVISKELNHCFQNYPNWEEELLKDGIDKFISSTVNFHINNKTLNKMLHQYFYHHTQ